MTRSVLIVTPFFAPQNHSAVFRAYKLAKYLPRFGWKPIVLTVQTQYQFSEDEQLLADLPPEVEIVRTSYIEPTLRGLRMALGGEDSTFAATRSRTKGLSQISVARDQPSMARNVYRSFLEKWFQAPDEYWTWAKTAIRAGKKILRDREINLVFTTAPPFSSLLVGEALQKAGAAWVADFRDPLAYTLRLSSRSSRVYWQQRKIVRDTLRNAEAVTVAASCFSSIYFDMFGQQRVEPVFIPTGMDEDIVPREPGNDVRPHPYLLFAGEYLSDYDCTFLESFANALKRPDVRQTGTKLLVVGTLELNHSRMMPLIDKFDLHDHVEFLDQQPQREVYKLLAAARAGVLIPGSRAYWWTTFAKMTDYIGMRKRVVAIVPDPSEARTALNRTGLGIFLDGTSEERSGTLAQFLLGESPTVTTNETECERYTARRQVQSFAELFETVYAQRRNRTDKSRMASVHILGH
jgi:glycosyltransferase involved in cell wall biosynthesis